MFTPETRVGAAGALLLLGAYGVLVVVLDPESLLTFEPVRLAAFAVPAFAIGCVVAAVAQWYVPAERRNRRAHGRTVLTMLLGPTAVVVVAMAFLAVVVGVFTDLLAEAEAAVDGATGASGPLAALFALLIVLAIIVAIVLVVAVIALLAVLGIVVQFGAVVGYAVTTVLLGRQDGGAVGESTVDPPD